MSDGGKSPIPYERPGSGGISRWQFRLLLALGVANLALTLQIAYAPGAGAAIKKWWNDHQTARRVAAQLRQVAAHTEASGKVVWDDNPETAPALLQGPGYRRVPIYTGANPLVNLPTGALASPPAFGNMVHSMLHSRRSRTPEDVGVLFLHGLKTASGEERLVLVHVYCRWDLRDVRWWGEGQSARGATGNMTQLLDVDAAAFTTDGGKTYPRVDQGAGARLLVHDERNPRILRFEYTPSAGDKPEQFKVDAREWYRFYAGQVDPQDPSRFTIDYEVNGVRGTMRGWLRDNGTLELKPSTGAMVGSRWYPLVAGPATAPATGSAAE